MLLVVHNTCRRQLTGKEKKETPKQREARRAANAAAQQLALAWAPYLVVAFFGGLFIIWRAVAQ